MRFTIHDRLVSVWSGVVPAVLACVFFAGWEARGGCHQFDSGNRNPSDQVSSRLESLRKVGALAGGTAEVPHDGPSRPRPCSGAFCSGNPAPPLSSAPSQPPEDSQWAIHVIGAEAAVRGSLPAAPDQKPLRSAELVSSIFHPPRGN